MNSELKARFAAFSAKLTIVQERKKVTNSKFPPKDEPIRSLIRKANVSAEAFTNFNDPEYWATTHQVLVGQIQECRECGNVAECTTGFFQSQKHKVLRATRLLSVDWLNPDLETKRAVDHLWLPTCIACNESPLVDDLLVAVARKTSPQLHNQLDLFHTRVSGARTAGAVVAVSEPVSLGVTS